MMFDNPITGHVAANPAWDPAFAINARPSGKRAGKPIIPQGAADITTAWLNQVLGPHLQGHSVIGCQTRPHDMPGQTADIVELWLHYDSAQCPLPARMIAKLGATDPTTRDLARTFRLYEREAAFYGSVGDDDLPIARCFHAAFEPESYDTVLLLEHLAPSYCPSFAISPEQVHLAFGEAARLHARYWNDEFVLDHPGLIQLSDPDHWPNFASANHAAISTVRALFGESCPQSIAMAEAYSENFSAIMRFMRSRPFTLQHSDFHPKQLFFPDAAGEGKFAVIDFQFSVAGSGATDIMRLLHMAPTTDVRIGSHERLFAHYLATLARHGVEGYGWDDLATDIKLGVMMTQLINFIALDQTDVSVLQRECEDFGLDWRDIWLLRGERMVRELDVPGFLRSL
ncbi:MAG: phosphotransferase [Novosphingobium sp.]|jgi:hypothetical protein|uniref:phosphotransferase n=1 Tax=Novosphingobium sp. TaxID=1874826 RepID=UPI00391C3BC1